MRRLWSELNYPEYNLFYKKEFVINIKDGGVFWCVGIGTMSEGALIIFGLVYFVVVVLLVIISKDDK